MLTLDWLSAAVAVVGELVVFLAVGLRARGAGPAAGPLLVAAPLAGVTMVLYGRPSGETYLRLGWCTSPRARSPSALATRPRLVAIALPAVVLLATIDPTDLADGLAQSLRLPGRFVLGALAGLRLVGLFLQDWRALELARAPAGSPTRAGCGGSPGRCWRCWCSRSDGAAELATAMEARGFDGPTARTWARPRPSAAPRWSRSRAGLALGRAPPWSVAGARRHLEPGPHLRSPDARGPGTAGRCRAVGVVRGLLAERVLHRGRDLLGQVRLRVGAEQPRVGMGGRRHRGAVVGPSW